MARNRPRQNMSLGPNDGGFGSGQSNAFAGSSSGASRPNRPNNRPNRPNNQGGQSSNLFDTPIAPLSGTGVQINQSGNISPPSLSFDDWLSQNGHPGRSQLGPNQRERLRAQWQAAAGAGAGGGDPFTPPVQDGVGGAGSIFDDPLASNSSGGDNTYMSTAWGLLNQAGVDNDPVFGSQQTAWLNDEINNLWQRWKGEAQIHGEDRVNFDDWLMNMTGGPAPGTTPDLNYVQTQWGPAMKNLLARQYQAATPRQRGTDMRQWQAPRRVIQF